MNILVAEDDNPAGVVLAREDVLVKIPDREMAQSSQDRETLEKIAAHSKAEPRAMWKKRRWSGSVRLS